MTEILTPEKLQGVEDRMNTPAMYEVSYTEVRDLIATVQTLAATLRAAHRAFVPVNQGDGTTGWTVDYSAIPAARAALEPVKAWL